MSGEERGDLEPAMDWAAVPEPVDRSAEVTQEVTEEGLDSKAGEIMGPTPEVECHSPSRGRHRQATADRQTVVAVAVREARPLALGAQVRRPFGMSRNPLSSTNTRWAPRRAAFF